MSEALFSMRYHLKSIHYAPRLSDPRLAGGALLDIGIYPLTYAWRLMGRPERVECKGTVTGGKDETFQGSGDLLNEFDLVVGR